MTQRPAMSDNWDDHQVLWQLMLVFDESWAEKFGTTGAVFPVRAYLRQAPEEMNRRVVTALQGVFDAGLSDTELDRWVVDDLGARIYFPGMDMTATEWLSGSLAAAKEELAIAR